MEGHCSMLSITDLVNWPARVRVVALLYPGFATKLPPPPSHFLKATVCCIMVLLWRDNMKIPDHVTNPRSLVPLSMGAQLIISVNLPFQSALHLLFLPVWHPPSHLFLEIEPWFSFRNPHLHPHQSFDWGEMTSLLIRFKNQNLGP